MNRSLTASLLAAWALAAAAALPAHAESLPILTGEKAKIDGRITPAGDVDAFGLDLFAGDRVTVRAKESGPLIGLLATLTVKAPDGSQIDVPVDRQGSRSPSFTYVATTTGVHVVEVTGDPGGFGGAEGDYSFTSKIKRVKPDSVMLNAPAGGAFAIPIQVSNGSQLDVKAKTKTGGFDIEGLFRSDGVAVPGFVEALKRKARRSASVKKFALASGFDTYELRGTYDAGSDVKIKLKVRPPRGAVTSRLRDEAPEFDRFLPPFPDMGIGGTLLTVIGQNIHIGSGPRDARYRESLKGADGGEFSIRFPAITDSVITVKAKKTRGESSLTALIGPDGRAESAFPAAIANSSKSITATAAATRGPGIYELRGTREAGAVLKLDVTVVRGDGVSANGLPRIWVGPVEIDASVIENPFDQVLRFRVPEALEPGTSYDIRIRNDDGQGAVAEDAFFFVPPPTVTSLTETEAGPAGGRSLRVLGTDFRPGVVVLFDETVVQPSFVLSNRIDVEAPPHAPGDVFPVVRDDLGQTATSPVALTYLDIGSNTITAVDPMVVQAVGGETVTVTGEDFGLDTLLYLDGRPIDFQRNSDTELEFLAPDLPGDTYELRVEDSYEQSSAVDLDFAAFTDGSDAAIPDPLTDENAIDGWRASRVLVGDVTGDGIDDLVLVRFAAAFGADADRPRVRVLAGDGMGGFTDATDGVPDVSAIDDWRARDAALADVDGDDDLDLLLITDDELDGGARSSLRLLLNDGDGGFTDATTASMPMATSAGDVNQGVALVVTDVDGQNGPDVVIVHTSFFQETIDESPPPPNPPPDPPPPPMLVTYYYPGTRVLLNDGDGIFTRSDTALPPVDEDSLNYYEGSAIAAADVDGQDGPDLVVTGDDVREDPDSPGTFLLRAALLANDGSGVFTDESGTWLPAGSGTEFLQGDDVAFVDFDGTGGPDLIVASDTRLVTPGTGERPDVPAFRVFLNDGTDLSPIDDGALPGLDGEDGLQSNGAALGDLTGDGRLDIVLVSPQAPNVGEHGARVLVQTDDGFVRGSDGFPSTLLSDDGRGRGVVLLDTDGDGDLDVVIVRDESDQTVRNTRVFVNPRLE